MKESDIQKEIMNAILPHVVFAFVTTAGRLPGNKRYLLGFKGLLDIVFMQTGGRLGMIEVKMEGKSATEIQQEVINNINKHGGTAGVAHNVKEAMAILDKPMGDWS